MENNSIKDIEERRNDPLEQRVFRLETAVIDISKTEGEMMDRIKNAHHRIDETNTTVQKMETRIIEINKKVDNIGINLAKKDERDKKWRKWIVVIGCLALAAFIGMFIQDSEIRKGIGEIALRIGVGAASAI
ncbi:MAG: hypothetical protein II903_10110 [Spirochaetales bacterium]|nr:hypothetical protein [Spirochaetales bacterium]